MGRTPATAARSLTRSARPPAHGASVVAGAVALIPLERFEQAHEFEVTYGGGEANVAVSLANYGVSARFVTASESGTLGASSSAEKSSPPALDSLCAGWVSGCSVAAGGEPPMPPPK